MKQAMVIPRVLLGVQVEAGEWIIPNGIQGQHC